MPLRKKRIAESEEQVSAETQKQLDFEAQPESYESSSSLLEEADDFSQNQSVEVSDKSESENETENSEPVKVVVRAKRKAVVKVKDNPSESSNENQEQSVSENQDINHQKTWSRNQKRKHII